MIGKDILAYHYALITGIQTVKKFAPRVIKDAQLPLIVLFADSLETIERAGNMTSKWRSIRAVLFVESVGMGTETSPYTATDPFFSRVEDYFEARTTLGLADGTTELLHEYMNDGGETMTPYPTGTNSVGQFWAITFTHRFQVIKEVSYRSGL
jgi:hypothetical protein